MEYMLHVRLDAAAVAIRELAPDEPQAMAGMPVTRWGGSVVER